MRAVGLSVAAHTTKSAISYLEYCGVDRVQLGQRVQVDLSSFLLDKPRISVDTYNNVLLAGAQLANSRLSGLELGFNSDPNKEEIVGLAFLSSKDLREALKCKARYAKILAEHIELEFVEGADVFTLRCSVLDEYFSPYEIERVFTALISWIQHFVGQRVNPVRVGFKYAKPTDSQPYENYFRCPLYFNHTENYIVFPAHLLACHSTRYNNYLSNVLSEKAETVLTSIKPTVDFVSRVRNIISSRLGREVVSAEDIAATLHVSRRTFSRKLQECNVSYQALLDGVRKEMAFDYLADNKYPLQNLPSILGYADARGFSRAFHRWAGCSPTEYIKMAS